MSSREGRAQPLQVQGQLPGVGDGCDVKPLGSHRAAAPHAKRSGRQRDLPGKPLQRPVEDVAGREPVAHGRGGVDRERVRLAQRQQTQAVVEVAVGQQQPADRRVPRLARPESPKDSIWARTSGEALIRNQETPSALTATDSCVRGLASAVDARTNRQLAQPQFHCGKPPPAAEPSTRTRNWRRRLVAGSVSGRRRLGPRRRGTPGVAIAEVALIPADFRAHVDLDEGRGFPFHVAWTFREVTWPASFGDRDLFSLSKSASQGRRAIHAHMRAARILSLITTLVVSFAAQRARATELYVSTEDGGEIVVIDAEHGEVRARIPVGKRPRGVKLSHDGKLLYVALSGSPRGGPGVDESKLPPPDRAADGIGVVELATRKLVRTLASGQDPESFDLSPDGKLLYVSNEESSQMSVVDLAAGKVTAQRGRGRRARGRDDAPRR